jgi:hypothetical protein
VIAGTQDARNSCYGNREGIAMRVVLILFLLAVLALGGVYAYEGLALPGPAMPDQGYTALAIGAVFSLIVGIGLMALLFYSSRRGYDEPPKYK